MFDLEDASNDGTIDAQEFALVCSSYGLDANECEQAFAKMSKVSFFFSLFTPNSLMSSFSGNWMRLQESFYYLIFSLKLFIITRQKSL